MGLAGMEVHITWLPMRESPNYTRNLRNFIYQHMQGRDNLTPNHPSKTSRNNRPNPRMPRNKPLGVDTCYSRPNICHATTSKNRTGSKTGKIILPASLSSPNFGLSERVADIKTSTHAMKCLTTFPEAVGPGFIFERAETLLRYLRESRQEAPSSSS